MHITLINCVKTLPLYISHHCIPDYHPQSNANIIFAHNNNNSVLQKIITKKISNQNFCEAAWGCHLALHNKFTFNHTRLYAIYCTLKRSVMFRMMMMMMWAIGEKGWSRGKINQFVNAEMINVNWLNFLFLSWRKEC